MWFLLILLHLLCFLPACGQDSSNFVSERFPFQLGNSKIYISKTIYDSTQPYVMVQLHGNESTALEAAMHTMKTSGGTLLRISHSQRNISFLLNNKHYTFDPNRMFSRRAIQASLQTYGHYSSAAINAVDDFAQFFLSHIPDSAIIIALHNNSDNRFSALSYRNNRDYENVAADLHINEALDPDNFFLLTDKMLFDSLRNRNYNVVLQDNRKAEDDGSLSIWCGRRNRKYINVEAQAGADTVQQAMLGELLTLLKAQRNRQ